MTGVNLKKNVRCQKIDKILQFCYDKQKERKYPYEKWISLLLCLTLLLSLTACGTGDSGETTVIATAVPAQTEPTQAESAPEDGIYTVSTPDEFIDATGSDRTIHVSGGTLDLSTARSYGKDTGNEKCAWEEEFDGYQLVIHDVKNLTITGDGQGWPPRLPPSPGMPRCCTSGAAKTSRSPVSPPDIPRRPVPAWAAWCT